MENVMVFVDGANLFFSLLDRDIDVKFNYTKFVKKLVGPNRNLIRVYYYDSHINQDKEPERYGKQQSFFYFINRLPYFELRKGRMLQGRQKGVDVRIAIDMLTYGFTDKYDVAILVSGDSDLVPAVEAVKAQGKHVELAFLEQCWDLRNCCDIFTKLDKEYFSDCS